MSYIDFILRVEIDKDDDFERKKMEKAVFEFAEKNLGETRWVYKTFSVMIEENHITSIPQKGDLCA